MYSFSTNECIIKKKSRNKLITVYFCKAKKREKSWTFCPYDWPSVHSNNTRYFPYGPRIVPLEPLLSLWARRKKKPISCGPVRNVLSPPPRPLTAKAIFLRIFLFLFFDNAYQKIQNSLKRISSIKKFGSKGKKPFFSPSHILNLNFFLVRHLVSRGRGVKLIYSKYYINISPNRKHF